MAEFKPILYLKRSCPFCLKIAAFLSEANIFDQFELRAFWPGDDDEISIREELALHLETLSFPAVQHAPGNFLADSDAIIEHYREIAGLDLTEMPFYDYVLSGPFRRLREQFSRIRELELRAE